MKLTEVFGTDSVEEAIEQLRDGVLEIVDHDGCHDEDRDHGVWTERYVIEKEGKFFEVLIEFFGQGEVDYDMNMYKQDLVEVFPEVITKTIYKRK